MIDPLLRSLGWDLEDLSQVIPEYSAGKGKTDYACFGGGQYPALHVEAKSLGTNLRQGIEQSVNYCIQTGAKYFAVTDGQKWEVYDVKGQGPLEQNKVISFDMVSTPDNELAMKLLWLWRGNFLKSAPASPSAPIPPIEDGPEPPLPNGDGADWLPLDTLQVKSGQPPPASIKFPDGDVRSVSFWLDIQRHVIEWAAEKRHLTPDMCPIKGPRGGIIVDAAPAKSSGKPFGMPVEVPGMGLWWDKNWDAVGHPWRAKLLLASIGIDSATVHVKLKG